MKKGSLVVCVRDYGMMESLILSAFNLEVIMPVINNIYTIRGIVDNGKIILLEEIVNKPLTLFSDKEPGFNSSSFRLLNPDSQNKIVEIVYPLCA